MLPLTLELPLTFLDAASAEIRSVLPNWQTLFQQHSITADQMSMMSELTSRDSWSSIVAKDDNIIYIKGCIDVIKSLPKSNTAAYCLVCIYDLLVAFPQWAERTISNAVMEVDGLFPILESDDEILAGLTARLIAILLLLNDDLAKREGEHFASWATAQLESIGDNESKALLVTLVCSHVLRVPRLRPAFGSRKNCMENILDLLSKFKSSQVQYQSVFLLWLLSFDTQMAKQMISAYRAISVLLEVSKSAAKDKVIRICISTWRNLLSKSPDTAVPIMIGVKIVDFIESMRGGKITDEETTLDATVLIEDLRREINSLNSFDEYASEVKSGRLQWSPPHKSTLFWKDNAARLAENDLELLKFLARLLDPNINEPNVVAIAAHDIGMYLDFHIVGRRNFDEVGAKPRIMALIGYSDPEVRFQALSTMQKYMKKLWSTT